MRKASLEDGGGGHAAGRGTTPAVAASPVPDDAGSMTPILPAHIEDTVAAIARLHAEHRLQTGSLQRLVERLTASIGRPDFIAGLTALVMLWTAGNVAVAVSGGKPWDAAPFAWLQGALGLLALYVTVLILTTQRREDQLAGYREQLTLELAILGEQKSAKIISLLEEMRRDNPMLRDRVDEEATAMAVAADPQAVLDAIKKTEAVPLAAAVIADGETVGGDSVGDEGQRPSGEVDGNA